jgi:hypothetical protein
VTETFFVQTFRTETFCQGDVVSMRASYESCFKMMKILPGVENDKKAFAKTNSIIVQFVQMLL